MLLPLQLKSWRTRFFVLEHNGVLRYYVDSELGVSLGELHVLHCALYVGGECIDWPADAPAIAMQLDSRLEFVTRDGLVVMAIALNGADAQAWRNAVQRVRIRLTNLVDLHHIAG